MKQHYLSNHNGIVIKSIAKELPNMPLGSWDRRKIPKNKWLIGFAQWLFTATWPNGDRLMSDKVVISLQKRWFGLQDHDRSHERRLRRAYLRNGLLGITQYLNTLNVAQAGLTEWLADFQQTTDDIRNIKKYEKEIGKKLLV